MFDAFVEDLKQSRLVVDPPSDVTELFDCYDATIIELLDKLHAPWRSIKTLIRQSAPWFAAECHSAKSSTRRLEKVYRRKPSLSTVAAWTNQFDAQRSLFQGKYIKYWSDTISSSHGDYKTVWSKLQPLLKSGHVTSTCLTADEFAHYFADKIDRIRASTAASPSPVITDRLIAEPLYPPLTHVRR